MPVVLKYHSVRARRIWEKTSLRSLTDANKKFVFNVSGIKGKVNGATKQDVMVMTETIVIKLFKVFIHLHYQMCMDNREKLFIKTSGQILTWIRNNSASASLICIDLHT